jgi:hypothetical protein
MPEHCWKYQIVNSKSSNSKYPYMVDNSEMIFGVRAVIEGRKRDRQDIGKEGHSE